MSNKQKDSSETAGEGVPERVWIDNPKLDTERRLYSSPCPELEPAINAVKYVRARAYSPSVDEAARRIINHLTRIIATAMKGEK